MRDLHIITVYTWITLRLFQAIDAHSGYGVYKFVIIHISIFNYDINPLDFPWSLQHILPFWSGAEHHDFHHMAFTNNYSTSFRWWDRILGTDNKYRAYRKKVEAAKAAMKNATQKDKDEIERKMMAEVEAEGIRAEAEVEGRTVKVD